ncbi:hypothetical protein CDAR_316861 [Caerostris darwini]|uniref:Uncharacterized protein n=1 Tax=Caerostris darwini TaxID=1538125 RepID=A0AAV4T3V3_9ARAC|nr:hypothetical protein CDAR_316861 [Caerostris darwini]
MCHAVYNVAKELNGYQCSCKADLSPRMVSGKICTTCVEHRPLQEVGVPFYSRNKRGFKIRWSCNPDAMCNTRDVYLSSEEVSTLGPSSVDLQEAEPVIRDWFRLA